MYDSSSPDNSAAEAVAWLSRLPTLILRPDLLDCAIMFAHLLVPIAPFQLPCGLRLPIPHLTMTPSRETSYL